MKKQQSFYVFPNSVFAFLSYFIIGILNWEIFLRMEHYYINTFQVNF